MNIKSRLEKLENDVAHLKYKSILEEGGEATFQTVDGKVVKINHEQYMDLLKQMANRVWNDKEIEHELLDDINQAKDEAGIGNYLKCMVGK